MTVLSHDLSHDLSHEYRIHVRQRAGKGGRKRKQHSRMYAVNASKGYRAISMPPKQKKPLHDCYRRVDPTKSTSDLLSENARIRSSCPFRLEALHSEVLDPPDPPIRPRLSAISFLTCHLSGPTSEFYPCHHS